MTVEMNHVYFAYHRGEQILNDVSCLIRNGEFVSVLGRNGSGKTSFGYSISGLIPNAITGVFDGKVLVNGIDNASRSVGEIARDVGMVFQDPNLVLFNPTVEEEILFGIRNTGLDRPNIRVQQALEQVALCGFEKRDPQTLSEGQKQKLCIACVLAMGTEIILLDEPVSHLDYDNALLVYETLRHLSRKGKTIIVIEHETDMVWEYASRVIVLDKGKIVEDGETHDILGDRNKMISYGIKPVYKHM